LALIAIITSLFFYRALRESDPLLAKASPDPDLRHWLAEWKTSDHKPSTAADRAQLEKILSSTTLSCTELIELGRLAQVSFNDDPLTAEIYGRAFRKGHDELAANGLSPERKRTLLIALNSTRSHMWRVIDGGHHEFVPAMSVMTRDLVYYVSPDDRDLKDARIRAEIGAAGCLYLEGKINEAVASVQNMDARGWTSSERIRLGWIKGLILFQAGKYSEAQPELAIGSQKCAEYKHAPDARALAVINALRMGNLEEARDRYKEYLQLHIRSVLEQQARISLAIALRQDADNAVN
jgi:hypothetical protein